MLPASSPQPAQNGSHPDEPHIGHSGDLRRNYLTLLPPTQVIDICLHFEPHVPLHIRHTVWPVDIGAEIATLKRTRAQTPSCSTNQSPEDRNVSVSVAHTLSEQVRPPGTTEEPSFSLKDVLDSVQASRASSVTRQAAACSSADQPSDPLEHAPSSQCAATTSSAMVVTATASAPPPAQTQSVEAATPASRPPAQNSASLPPSQNSPSHPPDPAHAPYLQSPYPYPSYGYPGHAPYAQAPYYASPSGYLAPYPGYQPYTSQSDYSPLAPHHAQMYPPRPFHLTHPPHTPHQHAHNISMQVGQPSGEDLPSYEDMLVEALADMGDLEGSAPKDIFLWMESRYPLQTNFRPSASQALQKAFRRGRFEKRPNGKYRLNPSWEGGATSKRTTRRPQTLAQTAYAQNHPPQSSSLFTHTPLTRQSVAASPPPQAASSSAPSSTSQTTPYPGHYSARGYGGYPAPAYGAPPSQLQPPTPTAARKNAVNASDAADSGLATKESTQQDASQGAGEGGDAWEAAQHILQAINYGSIQASSSNPTNSANPAPLISAEAGFDYTALAESSDANAEFSQGVLTNKERASLQAQLALLAAQLSEIAELGEDDERLMLQTSQHLPRLVAPVQVQPSKPVVCVIPPPRSAQPPSPIIASSSAHVGLFVDINHFTNGNAVTNPVVEPSVPTSSKNAGNGASGPEEDESDDDMEVVEVPTMSTMDALRT